MTTFITCIHCKFTSRADAFRPQTPSSGRLLHIICPHCSRETEFRVILQQDKQKVSN